jgi:hypothetical protein
MKRKVAAIQFTQAGTRIRHKPTGAEFVVVGNYVVAFGWGKAGQVLPSGEWYEIADVKKMAKDIAEAESQSSL